MFKNSAGFSKNLDRATSNLLLEPDWDAILAICDAIRQGDVAPKPALDAVKKKLQDKNPHVALYALQVLDAVVKNCGKSVHDEIINMPFMEDLHDMAKRGPEDVRNRILEVIQCWAHGFREKPQYRVVQDTVNLMKTEGYKFPAMKEADALFVAESAPEWVDGDCCHRCRTGFSLTNRKHHCRSCGQIFCSKCSSKIAALPKYGIEKEVRVCDPCYDALSQPKTGAAAKQTVAGKDDELPAEYLNSSLSKEPQAPKTKTKEEIQEEEELQLALAISQSEAEAKLKLNQGKSTWSNSAPKYQEKENKQPEQQPLQQTNGDLEKYLNRKYWEEKNKDISLSSNMPISAPSEPSAPTPSSTPSILAAGKFTPGRVDESLQNGEVDEIQQFMTALKTQINVFTNRMRSNMNRGRPLANDPTIISLFNNLLPMRQQLMEYTQSQDQWKEYYERLQEKLTRLKEAREALDVLREEHRDKLRMEAEERHRMMQMQMISKLDTLRLKKREYLEYQRQVAFQQMQAQEQELMRRKQMSSYQPYSYIPGYAIGTPAQPGGPATYPGNLAAQQQPPGYAPPYSHPQQIYQQIPQQPQQQIPPGYYNQGPVQQQGGFQQQQHQLPPDYQQATFGGAAQGTVYQPYVGQQQQVPIQHQNVNPAAYPSVQQGYSGMPQPSFYPQQNPAPNQPPLQQAAPHGVVQNVTEEQPLISFD